MMRKGWAVSMVLALVVACFGFVVFAQEVAVEAESVAEGHPLWVVLLVALVPVIIAIMERMGKKAAVEKVKDAIGKLNGALEVGQTVFAAIEETEAKEAKNLIKEVMTGTSISPAGKEINNLLHSVTDVKAAGDAPPLKRFFRRALAGKNFAGVVARIAGRAAIADLLNKEDDR